MADEAVVPIPIPEPTQKKPKPTKVLPTDRIAFSKQLDILRAFGIAAESNGGKPVVNTDVATIVKMSPNTLPHANGFFADIGLLQRGEGFNAGYVPSAEVMSYHRAHQWNSDTAAQKLAPVFQNAWFGQALLPRLSFRSMEESEAIGVLADASGAPPEYRAQLSVILSYLETVGLIAKEGTLVKANKTPPSPVGQPTRPGSSSPSRPAMHGDGLAGAGVATTFNRPSARGVQFQVNVDVDMKEMATWSPERIAAFFNGIAQVISAKGAIERLD